jgi:hypothetical protein
MKHLNEIGRIKELMSLINEGEGLKFLERLLLRGETNSIKKAEGAIDDVFKVLDDETISKLESLGIRDATDLGTKLSSLSEDLAANVARGLMRNSNDYSKMFFNLLRNNDSYDTAIKGLEDLIEKNASKIKTQADVDKIIDTLGSKSGWDPVVIFNVKQNVKPKVNISDLIDTGADASKVMKNVYAVLGGEENYKMVMKYVLGLVGISAVIGFVPLGLGTKGMDWWNNRGKEPQFMDDELIKKIVNGTLDSDFETYFPEYSLAISDNFKTKLSTLINGIKTQTESPYELNLTDDYFKTIPDGFYLKYVLDYAKSQGVNYVKDDIIEQSIDNISKPFYIYKPLASINSETEFQSFEMNREELVKKYTTIKRKCPNETTWTDVTPSEDLYNVVNKSVIGYLLNKKKSSVKGAIDIVDKKAKDALGIDLESEVMTEDALKEKINKSLGSSPIFADDIKNGCEFNYSFLIRESKKGLINILEQFGPKKKDNTKVNKGNTSGGGVKTFPGPGTVQQFQDWLDTNYPTWLNGGKLNKGKGYGSYGPSTQKAFTQYGSAYQNSSSNSSGNVPQPETVDKSKEIFDKFNDSVFFYSVNNERMNIEYTQQIGKWIKYYSSKKFNEESSYLGSVLSAYGNMISKYKTDEEIQTKIDTQLPNLQTYLKTLFEGIQLKRRIGLSEILEQVSNLVTVNVVNRIPQKQTEDDNYKDATNITIKSIIGGGTELRKGDRSDTIVRVKSALGYTKDTTPYFTEDFNTFVINYKGTNKLDNTNGNISKDLMCSIEQYKKLCVASSGQKTTAPPTNTTTSTPIELKYLNDYANAVGTGIPEYGTCKSLFDYYSEQALNYRRLKKVNKAPQITPEQLKPIKDKILYCQKSSDLKDRAKLDTLISQRFRIQQDKDSPYYLDI